MESLTLKNEDEVNERVALMKCRPASRSESFKRQNALSSVESFANHDSESLSINSENSDQTKISVSGSPENFAKFKKTSDNTDALVNICALSNKRAQWREKVSKSLTEDPDRNRIHPTRSQERNSAIKFPKRSSESLCNGPLTSLRRPVNDDSSQHRKTFSQISQNLERSIGRFYSRDSEDAPNTDAWQSNVRPRLSSFTYADRPPSTTPSNSLSFSCKILPSHQILRSTSVGNNNSCVNPDDAKTTISRNPSKHILTRRNSQVFRHQFEPVECLKKECKIDPETPDPESPKTDVKPEKPKIPDGGWGWVVVMSSLVISMIADGISFSFGLLYIEFLTHYQESKSKTSWIGSLFMAVPLLLGPVGSILVDKYGCRAMTMLGGVISGTGFILSSVSTTIEQQFLTFGVIAGSGLGLCYMTAVVSVAYWFDKKRTLATSLGACGTGIGTFVYAPMTTFFIEEYGWRGAILLLAGTFLNLCVCGAVMRDPEWWILEQRKSNRMSRSNKSGSSTTSISGRSDSDFPGVEELRRMLKSGQTQEYVMTEMITSTTDKKVTIDPIPEEEKTTELTSHAYCSVVNIPTFVRQQEKVPFEVLEQLSNNKRVFNVILKNYPSLLLCRSMSDNGELHQSGTGSNPRLPVTMSLKVKPTRKCLSPPSDSIQSNELPASALQQPPQNGNLLSGDGGGGIGNDGGPGNCQSAQPTVNREPPVRADSGGSSGPKLRRQNSVKDYPCHYLKDIRLHRNSLMHRGAMLNIQKYHMRASSCPNIYRNSITTIAKNTESRKCCGEWTYVFAGLVDFSMFLELHFLLLSVATILLFTWFIVPYFYLSDFVINSGMSDSQASMLLSVIGVANTIGMVSLGWAGDQPWMNVTKVYSVCLCLCGVSAGLMPLFVNNYWALLGVSASFGMFFASNYSFTPTILVELIPLNRFTTAYGLILLCQGIGNLLGPPLAGWVFDLTDVWDYSFYLAGFWIIISGILMAVIPITKNRLIWGTGSLEKDKQTSS